MRKKVFITVMALPAFLIPVLLPAQTPSLGTASETEAFSNVRGEMKITNTIEINSVTAIGFPPGTLTVDPGPSFTVNPGPSFTIDPGPTFTLDPGPTSTAQPGPTFTADPSPILTVTVNSATICAGSSVVLNAGGANSYVWQPGNMTGSSVTVSPASSTNYTVTGTSFASFTSAAVATVVVNENPTLTASAGTGTIYLCYVNCSTLTANASGGLAPYSYTWSSGSNNSTAVVCPTLSSGYTVTANDANGCSATAQVNVSAIDACCGNKNNNIKVIICHKGIQICVSVNAVPAHLAHGCSVGPCEDPGFESDVEKNIDANTVVIAYPNPLNSSVNIRIKSKEEGNVTVTISDINGKVVSKSNKISAGAGETTLNWAPSPEVPGGIYFCEVVGPDFTKQLKLVVVK